MKTTITTESADSITINSIYKGNKLWSCSGLNNYNNHLITVKTDKGRTSFEYWGSINTINNLVYSLYCFISDANYGAETFDNFCSELGYNIDSRKDYKVYKACQKSNDKFTRIFDCDACNLLNELQETYDL
jgi:hypothetical protein